MSDRDRKIAGENDVIAGWTLDEVNNLELDFLHKMFECSDPDGVDSSVTYAKYMSKVELDSDNYPVFMKLLKSENHWVIDALMGKKDPEHFFQSVQPNNFMLTECFRLLRIWKRGVVYPKSLMALFGLLKVCYEIPQEGYKLYPLNITDINNLGKHLDEKKDQSNPLNQLILSLLDRIAALHDPGGIHAPDQETLDLATQANNIRGKFLDMTKKLREAIPDNLLKTGDFKKQEVAPSITLAKK